MKIVFNQSLFLSRPKYNRNKWEKVKVSPTTPAYFLHIYLFAFLAVARYPRHMVFTFVMRKSLMSGNGNKV